MATLGQWLAEGFMLRACAGAAVAEQHRVGVFARRMFCLCPHHSGSGQVRGQSPAWLGSGEGCLLARWLLSHCVLMAEQRAGSPLWYPF